jgi:hypothetical protein
MPHDGGVDFNKIGLNLDAWRSRSGSCGRIGLLEDSTLRLSFRLEC